MYLGEWRFFRCRKSWRREEREREGTFFFEESATVFASELRNVILGELVEGLVEDGSEGGGGGAAVHGLRFRHPLVGGTINFVERVLLLAAFGLGGKWGKGREGAFLGLGVNPKLPRMFLS